MGRSVSRRRRVVASGVGSGAGGAARVVVTAPCARSRREDKTHTRRGGRPERKMSVDGLLGARVGHFVGLDGRLGARRRLRLHALLDLVRYSREPLLDVRHGLRGSSGSGRRCSSSARRGAKAGSERARVVGASAATTPHVSLRTTSTTSAAHESRRAHAGARLSRIHALTSQRRRSTAGCIPSQASLSPQVP